MFKFLLTLGLKVCLPLTGMHSWVCSCEQTLSHARVAGLLLEQELVQPSSQTRQRRRTRRQFKASLLPLRFDPHTLIAQCPPRTDLADSSRSQGGNRSRLARTAQVQVSAPTETPPVREENVSCTCA